ncbi:MAG: hypothetical protein ACLFRQ_05470 [Desulfonatronovibrio sp.]
MKKDNALIVSFPIMIRDLLPKVFQDCVCLLNPGLHEQTENHFLPQGLPLDLTGAKAFLSQSLQFGEQFKKPSDMAYFGTEKINDFYSDTSMALGWQISTYGSRDTGQDVDEDRLRAQQMLILEYVFQERMAELNSINASLGSAWKDFDSSLGIEGEDREFADLDRNSISVTASVTNWKKLIWAFTCVLPGDACLFIFDQQTAGELEECGVVWEKSVVDSCLERLLPEAMVYSGILRKGQKQAYLERIKHDVNLIMVQNFKGEK